MMDKVLYLKIIKWIEQQKLSQYYATLISNVRNHFGHTFTQACYFTDNFYSGQKNYFNLCRYSVKFILM